jgi:hypothetical protein
MSMEQVGNAIRFYAFYVSSKLGKTGLTVTVDVYKNDVQIVTGSAVTEVGGGLYRYTLASVSVDAEGEYVAIFKTTDTTVDQRHIPALWVIARAGIENLDAALSSRASQASLDVLDDYVDTEVAAIKAKTDTLPASPAAVGSAMTLAANALSAAALAADAVAEIADGVWDETLSGHSVAGGAGAALSAAGGAADPLLNSVPGTYPSGTAGYALGRIGSGQITTVSPVAQDGDVTLIQGDDYLDADDRALEWTNEEGTWPDLTDAEIRLVAHRNRITVSVTGEVVVPTGANQKVRVELTQADTEIPSGDYGFSVQAVLTDDHVVTLLQGTLTVLYDHD